MKKVVVNLPASVRQRLSHLATDRKEDFGLVLSRYGLERFPYRPSASAHRAGHAPKFRRRTGWKWCSGSPRVEDIHSHTIKVSYIPGRDGQTVHKGCGCDESVSIRARVRHVKRRAPLGNSAVNR